MPTMSYISGGWRRPSYITLNQELTLAAEQQHVGLLAPNVHEPIRHTGLTGDPHLASVHGADRHVDSIRRLWIPARLWTAGAIVAAARGTLGDTPIYAMPDGFAEQLLAFLRTPVGTDMTSIALRLYLATDINNIGPGICQMVSEMTGYVEGDAITAMGGGIMQNIDMRNSGGGFSLLEISQELAYTPAGMPVDGWDYFALQITRRGDLGGDTYTGTVNLIGMEVGFTFES